MYRATLPTDTQSPAPVDHAWQRKTLPLELVEHIFDLFFLENRKFEDIRPFSMANTQFRTVALRKYMSTLRIYSKEQMISYTLMHYSIASRSSPHAYAGFEWVNEGRKSNSGKHSESHLGQSNAPMVASRLTSLKMTCLWRIDVGLLSMVAKIFPALMDLHLTCSENLDTSCCWLCYEESSMAVIHSPIPGHYANTAFAEALLPLTRLVHLHLGIFLSDEDMLEENISRGTDEEDLEDEMEHPHDGELLPFPHGPGDCPFCAVRTRELEASLAMARKLRSVKTISWSSFFPQKQSTTRRTSVGDGRTTTTYVLRANGRIRVRRRPWD
ncbi:hypothetical protein EDC04DRAFT_2865931 [Pisolithus marmoratus]|nr:hypothetical protein EDC04DRAFT_2865931 [Pisolithus marmoratus]